MRMNTLGIMDQIRSDREKVRKLEVEWVQKRAAIYDGWKKAAGAVSDVLLVPRKSDVQVTQFGLAWAPFWRLGQNELRKAY